MASFVSPSSSHLNSFTAPLENTSGGHIAVNVSEEPSKNSRSVRGPNVMNGIPWQDVSSDNRNSYGDASHAWMAWHDLTVKVVNQKGETQTVLHRLSGYAEPGCLMAIMGPSGSGKSTLLDALAGRLTTNTTQMGKILLNGKARKLSNGTAAYLTQDDQLIGTLTVRESVAFSAQLRLPDGIPKVEKLAMVESVISEMGLQDCSDSTVGNWHLRGISGGEKRRLSIAMAILTRPHLLFLDEPTSGLDSASAFFVMRTIKNLARDGCTVITSIHQPSSKVFAFCDLLYLLSAGKTIFFGPASEACNFFASAGFPCPPLQNPSEHFLRCINADFDKVNASLSGCLKVSDVDECLDPLDSITTAQAIDTLLESYQTSQYAMLATATCDHISQIKGTVPESSGSQASFLMQTRTLTRRSFTNMFRDVGYYWLRLAVYILVSLCVGTIYYNVGTKYNSILARTSCGAFIFGFVTFMSIGGFPSFVEDMKVFQRERMNGYYGVGAFVMGNSLSSMPFLFVIAVASSVLSYFLIHLHPGFVHFLYFTLALYASVMVVEGMMMAIASVVPNFLMGIVIGAGIQGIFMMVAGFFRLIGDIPKPIWRYPVSFLSFDFWVIQGQFQNDLIGLEFDNQSPLLPKISGDYVAKQIFEIDTNRSKWCDLAVIFSMVVFYRLIFFIMIKVREGIAPWVRGKIGHCSLRQKHSAVRVAEAGISEAGDLVTEQNSQTTMQVHTHTES